MRRRTRCPFRLPLTPLPLRVTALAVSLGLGIAGCTTDPTPPDETQSSPATSPQGSTTSQATSPDATTDETSPTEPPESTSSTEPDETATTLPTPTTSSTPAPTRRLRAALVPAAELPGFNDSWTWDRQRVFRGAGLGALPGCSRANLIAIGGVAAVLSDYRSPASDDTAYAVQVTVRFPDEQTASRAESVLIAWHDRCEKTLRQQGRKNPQVGDIAAVTTDVATARQWLSTYGSVPGDPDATYFHAEGFVRSGHLLSYLILHNAGQDYNYEQGDEPMANALKKAAEFLNN